MTTAKVSEPITGGKLYQQRARAALPLLVRQASVGVPILYSDLAQELGMANARNLNYVLGSIGRSLGRLSKSWRTKIPAIQCLVLSKKTGLPGSGVGWFLINKDEFADLPLRRRREIVDAELQHVYRYPRWLEVLRVLSLEPVEADFTSLVSVATRWGGGGESKGHKKLKEYVAKHPEAIGLRLGTANGITEFALPSGDRLDVSFQDRKVWVAAEVKSSASPDVDLIRGLYQCVKYRAVMEAVQVSESRLPGARALLVLETQLPPSLIALRNLLGIEVIEGVVPHDD